VRVLVVVDETKAARLMRRGLREDGLESDVPLGGDGALWTVARNEYEALCWT